MGIFGAYDRFLFHQGTSRESYRKLGAQPFVKDGIVGSQFVLWAPHADRVQVLIHGKDHRGDLCQDLELTEFGVWEGFVGGATDGTVYQYIVTGADGICRIKSDPYAFRSLLRPENASVVCSLDGYRWQDGPYMSSRDTAQVMQQPMAVYEVHLGSWKRGAKGKDGQRAFLNYRDLADQISAYVMEMGYTHVELMGICEHPFDGSWGYQVTGYFSPTSRHGAPDDFRYFVDKMHQCGIGVILDWVPAHFPQDEFGLASFDGTPLYEPADPARASYPEWGTLAFDYEKPQVRSFLLSSAFYWINEFHIDALRVDAVTAMIYQKGGESFYGSTARQLITYLDLDAMDFLRLLSEQLHSHSSAFMIAEDSSLEEGITKRPEWNGLGFTMKWNMGWMNDTLRYMAMDRDGRRANHELLVHTVDYSFSERFILVLSHDEVVHLKRSLLGKMPGSLEEKADSLKALFVWQMTHPGKKLLFMGQDFGQEQEWTEERELPWDEAKRPVNQRIRACLRSLLRIYREWPALYEDSADRMSFEWISRNDAQRGVISYIRKRKGGYQGAILVICNLTREAYRSYACGVPVRGAYRKLLSTIGKELPGISRESGQEEAEILRTVRAAKDNRPYRLTMDLRPGECVLYALP